MTDAPLLEAVSRAVRDQYEILRELGRGGMATVFAARDRALDRLVAIKVMAPELLMTPGMIERFLREAQTVAKLRHSNIVAIHQVAARDGLYYFVMEYVEGHTLATLLEDGRRCGRAALLPAIVSVIAQAAGALQYAHDRGIIHRDVKPANIMIDAQGSVIMTDFGIAKLTQEAGGTGTNTIIGTPMYMSPEQCRGDTVGAASDQYSLGVVAYEMITGAPPFAGGYVTVMQAHAATEPPSIAELRADCPASVAGVVHRMLAKVAADRFPSIGEAARAIEAALAAAAPSSPLTTQAPVGVPGARGDATRTRRASWPRMRPGPMIAAAALITVGVVTAVAVRSGGDARPERAGHDREPKRTIAVEPPTHAGTPDSVLALVSGAADRLRRAEQISARGAYEEATDSLSLIAMEAQDLAARYPTAAAVDSLARSVTAAVRNNTERCEAYAALLRRRARAAPQCTATSARRKLTRPDSRRGQPDT